MFKCIVVLFFIAQGCAHSINGYIIDHEGNKIDSHEGKVNITLLNGVTDQGYVTKIEEGSFEFDPNITPGTYLLETLVPGYQTRSMRIKVPLQESLQIRTSPLPHSQISSLKTGKHPSTNGGSGSVSLTPPQY